MTVLKDKLPEDDESYTVQLSRPSNGAVLSTTKDSLEVVIMANDNAYGRVGFANSSLHLRAVERDHDVAITFDLVREFGLNRDLTIHYEVIQMTSSSQSDVIINEIRPSSGVVRMLNGQHEQMFTLYLRTDDIPEVLERFEVR